jgi:hypothetical protein
MRLNIKYSNSIKSRIFHEILSKRFYFFTKGNISTISKNDPLDFWMFNYKFVLVVQCLKARLEFKRYGNEFCQFQNRNLVVFSWILKRILLFLHEDIYICVLGLYKHLLIEHGDNLEKHQPEWTILWLRCMLRIPRIRSETHRDFSELHTPEEPLVHQQQERCYWWCCGITGASQGVSITWWNKLHGLSLSVCKNKVPIDRIFETPTSVSDLLKIYSSVLWFGDNVI